MIIFSSEGDGDSLYMHSWYFWTASYLLCCRQYFRVDIFIAFYFFPLLLSPILSHQYTLCYFNIGYLDSWIRIRVNTGGHITYIIFQYRPILLQYLDILFLCLLKLDWGLFPHSVVRWILGDKIPRWFFNSLCFEYKHSIICPNFFLLGRCNGVEFYPIGLFSLGYRRDLDRGSTLLDVGGKVVSTEGGSFFYKTFPGDVAGGHLKGFPCLQQYWVHVMRGDFFRPIIQHPGLFFIILMRLTLFQ